MLSLKNNSNASASVTKLLRSLTIHADEELIDSELEKHPDYPSMLSVSDVLSSLKIENNAFRINFDELGELACPFIAHIQQNGGELLVVNKIKDGQFYVSNEKWTGHKIPSEEFKEIFSGVVLIAEPSLNSLAEKAKKPFIAVIKTPSIILGAMLILGLSIFYHTTFIANVSWQALLLILFKTAGLITSVLLLIQSVDSNNPLVQVLCQTAGKTNCNAILSSKAAKVFDGLSWSEVGFFYFGGTWLLLLFGSASPHVLQVLALLNFVSLPYTVYSIYHQARVAKQWCVLCCTVQLLLWLEFIPLVTSFGSQPLSMPGASELSTIFIALLAPVLLWLVLKPLLLKMQQVAPLKRQLRDFKYNSELFNKMLTNQPQYSQPDEDWSIVLGNTEASNVITMVTNPYCPPCARTHQVLDEWLNYKDDIQVKIVFTANNKETDRATPVSRHLMALNDRGDKTQLKRALHDWYEQKQKDYNSWAKAYPVELKETAFYKLDKQKAWCAMAEVTFTPTLLLNGYRIPSQYNLPDLKYMIE